MAQNKDAIKKYPEDRNMEYLDLNQKVYIPSGDDYGNVSWKLLSAITRHDPSEILYEITTFDGKTVTVADSETLLIWNEKTNTF